MQEADQSKGKVDQLWVNSIQLKVELEEAKAVASSVKAAAKQLADEKEKMVAKISELQDHTGERRKSCKGRYKRSTNFGRPWREWCSPRSKMPSITSLILVQWETSSG